MKFFNNMNIIRCNNPGFRRIADLAADYCVYSKPIFYTLSIGIMSLYLFVPILILFTCFSKEIQNLILIIISGLWSLIIVPLAIYFIKHHIERIEKLQQENKGLYEELTKTLITLLYNEYILHDKDFKKKLNKKDNKERIIEILEPLKVFLKNNFNVMCNTFSSSLIDRTLEVYDECNYNVTSYHNIDNKVNSCIRMIRLVSGINDSFYVFKNDLIKIFDDENN